MTFKRFRFVSLLLSRKKKKKKKKQKEEEETTEWCCTRISFIYNGTELAVDQNSIWN